MPKRNNNNQNNPDKRQKSNENQTASIPTQLTREQIEERIEQREIARARKQWSTADAIRQELRDHGVQILDKEAIWRGEDDSIGVYAGPRGLPEKGIRYIINYREQVRAQKNWALADSLRELLRDNGVQIFDKDGTWKTSSGAHGTIAECVVAENENENGNKKQQNANQNTQNGPNPHQQMPHYSYESGFECPPGCILVIDLLGKREEARAARDWVSADKIREVIGLCGIVIHDKTRTYSLQDGTICELPAMERVDEAGNVIYNEGDYGAVPPPPQFESPGPVFESPQFAPQPDPLAESGLPSFLPPPENILPEMQHMDSHFHQDNFDPNLHMGGNNFDGNNLPPHLHEQAMAEAEHHFRQEQQHQNQFSRNKGGKGKGKGRGDGYEHPNHHEQPPMYH